jgi:hypothetical protein
MLRAPSGALECQGVYLRSGRCHLSEETRSLGCRSLRRLLGWSWRLSGRLSNSRGGSLGGSGRGLCGGDGGPARGTSSTLTSHVDDELVVVVRAVSGVGLTWWWSGNSCRWQGQIEVMELRGIRESSALALFGRLGAAVCTSRAVRLAAVVLHSPHELGTGDSPITRKS